jgi:SAM-dependent methyltransferase
LTPDSFDVAILPAVLVNLYHPAPSIEPVARALRPGGIVFLDVPNERGLYFRVGNMYEALRRTKSTVNLSPTFAPYHVFGFSPVSLRKLLAEHGLQPIDWRVYAGTSLLPTRRGVVGSCESFAAKLVTHVSRFGELGTYIEAWARKDRRL